MTPEQLCTAVTERLARYAPFFNPTVAHTEENGDSTDWLVQTAIDIETGIMAYTEDGVWKVGVVRVEDEGSRQGVIDCDIAASDTDAAADFIVESARRYYHGDYLPPVVPDAAEREGILVEVLAQIEADRA